MSLRLIKLNSENHIPSIGLGTWDLPRNQTSHIVYEACKVGYRHFDTAVLYGNEREVSDGIIQFLNDHPDVSREEFFYTTKLWNNQVGSNSLKYIEEMITSKIGELKYIDLLLIHSPLPGKVNRLNCYEQMQIAKDKGWVKNIGVSNYGKHHIEELLTWSKLKYKPCVNQIEISPWCMRTELATWCLDQNIKVEAYAPLTHGYKLHEDPTLQSLSVKYGKSPAQLLIKWSLKKGYIPLPKTKTISRLSENLDINSFDIEDDDIVKIDHPDAYEPTDWECTDAP
ncbi:NADP-dependent oxidoreductase domain-containing protein [Scheffersomyces coipomensis]|uniref:NADP-dependent oxidoreductase domain-containing protein n=1 Tax=Scheffersomyces coipomensis TaxID=1788519 RepID=UPI00315CCEC4